jgi:hypothetical protein
VQSAESFNGGTDDPLGGVGARHVHHDREESGQLVLQCRQSIHLASDAGDLPAVGVEAAAGRAANSARGTRDESDSTIHLIHLMDHRK